MSCQSPEEVSEFPGLIAPCRSGGAAVSKETTAGPSQRDRVKGQIPGEGRTVPVLLILFKRLVSS